MVTDKEADPLKPVEAAPVPTPRQLIDLKTITDQIGPDTAPNVMGAPQMDEEHRMVREVLKEKMYRLKQVVPLHISEKVMRPGRFSTAPVE